MEQEQDSKIGEKAAGQRIRRVLEKDPDIPESMRKQVREALS